MTPSNDTPAVSPNRSGPAHRAARRCQRQLQTKLMVGLALAILGIILVTGHTTPVPHGPTGTSNAARPRRTHSGYQRQLADDEGPPARELRRRAGARAPHAARARPRRASLPPTLRTNSVGALPESLPTTSLHPAIR